MVSCLHIFCASLLGGIDAHMEWTFNGCVRLASPMFNPLASQPCTTATESWLHEFGSFSRLNFLHGMFVGNGPSRFTVFPWGSKLMVTEP